MYFLKPQQTNKQTRKFCDFNDFFFIICQFMKNLRRKQTLHLNFYLDFHRNSIEVSMTHRERKSHCHQLQIQIQKS